MLPWKLRKRQILPDIQNFSSVYFSLARFQLVSCNLSLAMIWQMTYIHKLPRPCSATLILKCDTTNCNISILISGFQTFISWYQGVGGARSRNTNRRSTFNVWLYQESWSSMEVSWSSRCQISSGHFSWVSLFWGEFRQQQT